MAIELQTVIETLKELGQKLELLDDNRLPVDFEAMNLDMIGAKKLMKEIASMMSPDDLVKGSPTRPSDRSLLMFRQLDISIPDYDIDVSAFDIPKEVLELEKEFRPVVPATADELMARTKNPYKKRTSGISKWLSKRLQDGTFDGMSSTQIAVEVRRKFKNSTFTGDNVRQYAFRLRKKMGEVKKNGEA